MALGEEGLVLVTKQQKKVCNEAVKKVKKMMWHDCGWFCFLHIYLNKRAVLFVDIACVFHLQH